MKAVEWLWCSFAEELGHAVDTVLVMQLDTYVVRRLGLDALTLAVVDP